MPGTVQVKEEPRIPARAAPAVAARSAASPPQSAPKLPLVYAVVPAFNRCDKTLRFLKSFEAVTYPNCRMIIVDDASTDYTRHLVELNYPEVIVLQGNGNLWWSGGTNMGVEYALANGADYILTINDDGLLEPDFLAHMIDVARQDPRYIVGCRIHCQDRPEEIWGCGSEMVLRGGAIFGLQFAGRRWQDIAGTIPDPYPVPGMPGNGVLIPRAVFETVGLYDRENLPQYHADTDLILRAVQAGFKPVISLKSVLYNHMLEAPLVTNRIDMIWSWKSDRYWRALWTILTRHCPRGKRTYLLLRQYSPFFFNSGIGGLFKRAIRRMLERRTHPIPDEVQLSFNPTCAAGPAGATVANEATQ